MAVLNLGSAYSLADVPTDLLDALGAGNALVVGTWINGIVGAIVFVWNFFQFVVSSRTRGVLLWSTGFVDFLFAVLLTIGCGLVGSFLPGTLGKCGDASSWKDAGGRNLFIEMSSTHDDIGARGECKAMVSHWILTIVMTVVYYILGIANMVIGYLCVYPDNYGNGGDWVSPELDLPVDVARRVFTPVILVVENSVGAIIFASRLACRSYRRIRLLFWESLHLPNGSRIWCRAWSRMLSRVWQMELVGNKAQGYELLPGANREPVDVLPLEIVYMIAGYSHYDDLKSLSQTSCALRTRLFGEADPHGQLHALRDYTCDGPKSSCTVCGSQICSSCTIDDKEVGTSKPLRHLNNCQSHCSSCYWDLRCGPKRNGTRFQNHDHQRFFCHVTANYGSIPALLPDVEPGMVRSPRPPATPKSTCRRCSILPLPDRRRVMEAKDEEAARNLWRGELECKICHTRLGKAALRWWLCSSGTAWCGGDCPNDMHPLTGLGMR